MINIYIAGEEVVCENNFTIQEEHLKTSSVILNKVFPKSWKGTDKLLTDFYFPKDYSNCSIYIDEVLKFSGVVKNSGTMPLNPFVPHYCSLLILDYKTLLSDSDTLDYVINDKTVSEAITQVVSSVSDYGFLLGDIDITDDTLIGAYSTLDKTPYDVLQYLSEISGTIWKTRFIDEDTCYIDFYDPDDVENVDNLEYSQEYFETNGIEDIQYSYSTNDYRNKQVILSDLTYGNIETNENIISDGYSKKYNTTDTVGTLNNIYVDDVEKTITTNAEKDVGIYADFYYTAGSKVVTASEIYNSGTVVNLVYTPLIKGRQIIYNNNEIMRLKEQMNRNGTISRYEKRNDVLSSSELSKIAETYIKYNGKAEVSLTIISRKSDLFNIGDKTYFDISEVSDLQSDYLVTKKETKIRLLGDEVNIIYIYSLSNNFNIETEINFFDNQRRKTSGNIDEGDFVTRNEDIESYVNIVFDNLETNELTIYGSNVLNSLINAPFDN